MAAPSASKVPSPFPAGSYQPHTVPTPQVLANLTTTQRDALPNATAGMVIYNSTTNKINVYNGTTWEAVTSV